MKEREKAIAQRKETEILQMFEFYLFHAELRLHKTIIWTNVDHSQQLWPNNK